MIAILFSNFIKKFSFPKIWFKPMFLTGSLAIFIGAAPPHFQNFAGGFPRRRRRRNAFGLFLEYSTNNFNYDSFYASGKNSSGRTPISKKIEEIGD